MSTVDAQRIDLVAYPAAAASPRAMCEGIPGSWQDTVGRKRQESAEVVKSINSTEIVPSF